MESNRRSTWTGGKASAMTIGRVTIDRIVRGEYEWRDAKLREMHPRRKRLWEEMTGGDETDDRGGPGRN